MPYPPQGTGVAPHNTTHEDGGADEIDVTGLVGLVTTFAALTDVQVVRKTADETVNTSAVLQNDNELLFPILANEVWAFEIFLIWLSGVTPDIKFAITVPSGTLHWQIVDYMAGGSTVSLVKVNVSGTASTAEGGGTAIYSSILRGVIANGATPGNVQLQWAQNTSNASDTKVKANSYLIAYKLA